MKDPISEILDNNAEPVRDEDIIQLAYSIALGPHRYLEMVQAIYTRIEGEKTPGKNLVNDVEAAKGISQLAPHFENAISLYHTAGRKFDTQMNSSKVMDSNVNPCAVFSPTGEIEYANKAAYEAWGFKRGHIIPSEVLSKEQHRTFMSHLANIESYEPNKVISIFGIENQNTDETIKVALTKMYSVDSLPRGYITSIQISWIPSVAESFQKALKLTDIEIEITQKIVTGGTLNQLAEERGRKVGTIRNQLKALLAKLHLRSQTELACLYSGFSKFDVDREARQNENIDSFFASKEIFSTPDNRAIDYEIFGRKKGRPVLFFPSLLGGATLTQNMRAALLKNDIRLITVWRPHFARSTPDGPHGQDALYRFSKDCIDLIEHLGIEKVSVIGHMTSAMYSFAIAKYFPNHVTHITNVNGIVPCTRGPHLALLDRKERLRIFVSKNAPALGKMIIYAFLSSIDSGYDEEVMASHVTQSKHDLALIKTPEIKELFREGYLTTTHQGFDCFAHEFLNRSIDWHSLTEGLQCPVTCFVGQENMNYDFDFMTCFIGSLPKEDRAKVTLINLENSGHLAFYQAPDVIFRVV